MPDTLDRLLQAYAELTVRVGLNVQRGQRLIIIGPLASGGVSLEAAPLVRHITESAYGQARHSSKQSRATSPCSSSGSATRRPRRFPILRPGCRRRCRTCRRRACRAVNLRQRSGSAEERTDRTRGRAAAGHSFSRSPVPGADFPERDELGGDRRGRPGLGREIFPIDCPKMRIARLWDEISRLCRLDRPDPVAAWNEHLEGLAARADCLEPSGIHALKYTGPGTDLTLGLPRSHLWVSGRTASRSGIPLHRQPAHRRSVHHRPQVSRVDGRVRATKPLSYGGTLIEGFSLRFDQGASSRSAPNVARPCCGSSSTPTTARGALGRWRWCPTARRSRNRDCSSTTRCSTRTPPATWRSAPRTSSRCKAATRSTKRRSSRSAETGARSTSDFMIGSGDLDVDGILATARASR